MLRRRESWLRGTSRVRRASGGVHQCCRLLRGPRMAGAMLATEVRLKDKCTHPWRHAGHASRARIDPRELAISILESNQAIFQGQRGARHDRGVIAASIIASPNGDVWRFADG